MPVGTGVVILDKDGGRAVELDASGNLPVYFPASGDRVPGGVFIQPGSLSAPVGTVINRNGNYSAAQVGTVVWTPSVGKRIYLYGAVLSSDTAGDIKVNMGATNVIPPVYLAINGNLNIGGFKEIWEAPSGDAALEITSNIAGNHSILLWGVEV